MKMKKILFTLSAVVTSFVGMAQVSMDMETWVADPVGSLQDPQGWASFNSGSVAGMAQTVFKETAAPYAGTASAKIVTGKTTSFVMVPNPFRPGKNFDTVGILGVGSLVGTSLKFGAPYAGRPAMLSFASKYTPMAGDSGFVLVFMTHYNGASRDTIASGKYAQGTTTTSYAVNTITLNYNPSFSTVVADTQIIFASSSVYSHYGPKMGSTLYVDDFGFSGWNSVSDISGNTASVNCYPNPTSNVININCSVESTEVEIMDVTGRVVGTYQMRNNAVSIQTTGFSPGMYFYNVMNKKQVLNKGKFEIAR